METVLLLYNTIIKLIEMDIMEFDYTKTHVKMRMRKTIPIGAAKQMTKTCTTVCKKETP